MLEFFAYKKYKKHKDGKEEDGDKKTKGQLQKKEEIKVLQNNGSSPGKDSAEDTVATASEPSSSAAAKTEPKDDALDETDRDFIVRILAGVSDEEAPPLPPRLKTPELSWELSDADSGTRTSETLDNEAFSAVGKDIMSKNKGDEKKHGEAENVADKKLKKNRLSFLTSFHRSSQKKNNSGNTLAPADGTVSADETAREAADISSVLSRLGLGLKGDDNDEEKIGNRNDQDGNKNARVVPLTRETADLVGKFKLVLRDLVTGVPTACDDLRRLLEDHDGVLSRNYERLPSGLKKLIATLPAKLTATLAPELLAVAAEAQGRDRGTGGPAGKEELKGATKEFLSPSNLYQLVTKPGAVASLLKGIVNALKARWPAFMGTNVVWAAAVSSTHFIFIPLLIYIELSFLFLSLF